jgi:hypothetical protein
VADPLADRIRAVLDEMSADPVEQIVVDYVARELNNGRKLDDILHDPYVRNRLSEDKVRRMLEDPAIGEAVERAVRESFGENRDIVFGD